MLRNLLLAGLAVYVFVSCGGGGEDEPPSSRGTVTIQSPTTADAFTASPSSSTVGLSGTASNATQFMSCSFSGTQTGADTGVTVRWNNASGGSGTASQSVDCCGIFCTGDRGSLCTPGGSTGLVGKHSWSASIPVVTGANLVTVTVNDSSGEMGRDTITVTR
jgi:hypothetical protein